MSAENSVLAMGAGKATAMHAGVWADLGWNVQAYDANPSRLSPETMQEDLRLQYEAGHVAVLHSLKQLPNTPAIFDIATSSGSHTDALAEALAATEAAPKAVLLEKPLDKFEYLSELLSGGELDAENVFVNENYNASAALAHMLRLAKAEHAAGNNVNQVYVSFDKNRVPDVLAGRFTDKLLGAYGIEVPHMLAVGLSLAGVQGDDPLRQVENRYGLDTDGVEHSEYTYTGLQTSAGKELIIAQGLGPFRMDEHGRRTPYTFQKGEAIRTATVTFADGRTATATFAPVPELPKFHSKVEWQDTDGEQQEAVFEDNTLRRVIGYTLECALTGERPEFTEGLTVANGIRYARQLHELREGAEVVTG